MKCSYCCLGADSGFKYKRRSVQSVISEIENAVVQHNAGFIDFEDENVSLDRNWFITLLGEIIKRFNKFKLEVRAMNGLFPPSLDEEVICLMKKAGFKVLNLAPGSSSLAQLKQFQRPDVRKDFDDALVRRLLDSRPIFIDEPYGFGFDCCANRHFFTASIVVPSDSLPSNIVFVASRKSEHSISLP